MINFALDILNIVWKILVITGIFMLAKGIMSGGRGALREIFDTIGMYVHLKVTKAQKILVTRIRAESEQAQKTEEA